MFEAIDSVMDAIVQSSKPRSLNAWLVLFFALGLIWYVAAGVMNGPTSRVALGGALVAIVALLVLAGRVIAGAARGRSGSGREP